MVNLIVKVMYSGHEKANKTTPIMCFAVGNLSRSLKNLKLFDDTFPCMLVISSLDGSILPVIFTVQPLPWLVALHN